MGLKSLLVKAKVKIMAHERGRSDVALVDTGATSTIIDSTLAEELKLKAFGERSVVTLGTTVKCSYADVESMIIEDEDIGPRRVLVYNFHKEVREKLRSMGCSDRVIVGVAEVESAGYIPNTVKGTLEKVGLIAF